MRPTRVYIWGYAGSQSVVQGGTINLHVSTTFKSFDFVVYRYGATGLQQMQRVNGLTGQWRDCPNSHLGCGWPVSYQLAVPESWRSGLYAVQLMAAGNAPAKDYASWILFVVRPKDPGSTSPVLYMLNEFTWQAYNYCNGLSFYPDPASGRGRANYLSFDRPYCTGDQPLTPACSFEWGCAPFRNLPLIKWLESNNYVVEYAANSDVHNDPTLLSHYRFFMDDAHDEYWSWPMRDQAEGFIAHGGNAAFFSSNTSFWQVRLENDGRTLVGFKNEVGKDPVLLDSDPTNDRLATTNWCFAPVNRCETQMLGITYFNGGNGKAKSCSYCSGGFQAWNPSHWIWAGTGVKSGQLFGDKDAYGSSVGIAAAEVDGALWQMAVGQAEDHTGGHRPGHPGQLRDPGARHGLALFGSVKNASGTMGVYTNTAGATVWVTGSWDWAAVGLAVKNPIVAQVTQNVLDRLAFSVPNADHRYGTVTVDGHPVAAGTAVTAICGAYSQTVSAQVFEGSSVYAIAIEGDEPGTPAKEGCAVGETIAFHDRRAAGRPADRLGQ